MAIPWIVRIRGTNGDGSKYIGTGFLVSDQGHVVTCWHVVEHADDIHIELPYSRPRQYLVYADARKHDLALLQALVPPDPQLPEEACNYEAALDLRRGQSLTAFGCSASKYYEAPRQIDCQISGFSGEYGRIGLDGNINAGDSGGPVVDENGGLVGVTQVIDPDNQGHAMAIPVLLIQQLIADAGVQKFSNVDKTAEIKSAARTDRDSHYNLPRQITSFVGRETCILELKTFLLKTSLLTLTGTGGCGKTRLALELASQVSSNYDDGVCVVQLAALRDVTLVANVVASTLGVPEQPGRPLVQALLDYLGNKCLLLVMDNCEHVLLGADTVTNDLIEPGCVPLIGILLKSCQQLRILATSRESLHLPGELIYKVPTLTIPPNESKFDRFPDVIMQFEATRLFVERARFSKPSFTLDSKSAVLVKTICRRLDGIPLALELAAAHVQTMSLEDLTDALRQRFSVLTYAKRGNDKSRTLDASIEWSYDLLTSKEKILLRRLSVFAGGWTLNDAEAVCSADGLEGWEILEITAALVDKSLVAFNDSISVTRYQMLETIREYGWKQMDRSGELGDYRTKHLLWCLALALEAEPNILSGDNQYQWLSRLETNLPNIRTALEWCRAQPESNSLGLQLAGALWRFWDVHSHFTEGRGWLLENIDRSPSKTIVPRAKALYAIGILATRQTDLVRARMYLDESVELLRQSESPWDLALALTILGYALRDQGNYEAAAQALEEGRNLFHSSGSQWGLGFALLLLGSVRLYQGDLDKGVSLTQEAQTISQAIKDQWVTGWALYFLGVADVISGNYEPATSLMQESLNVHCEIGERWGVAYTTYFLGLMALFRGDVAGAREHFTGSLTVASELAARRCCALALEGWAGLAVAENQPERAAILCAAVEASSTSLGSQLPLWRRSFHDQTMVAAAKLLDDDLYSHAIDQGRNMTLDEAIAYALSDGK